MIQPALSKSETSVTYNFASSFSQNVILNTLYLILVSLRARAKRNPTPPKHAERHDQSGLNGVDGEGEHYGLTLCHTIEHKHRLDGEMPRTRTVGGGHEHGKGAYAEYEEGCAKRELCGEACLLYTSPSPRD